MQGRRESSIKEYLNIFSIYLTSLTYKNGLKWQLKSTKMYYIVNEIVLQNTFDKMILCKQDMVSDNTCIDVRAVVTLPC